jgi:hypothetical protein
MSVAFHRLFSIVEIISEILRFLPCKDLVNFGHSHRRGRDISMHIICTCFRVLLNSFIPNDFFQPFVNSLHTTGSFIAGDAALWLILSPCQWKPQELDVFMPKYRRQQIVQVLQQAGFGPSQDTFVSRAHCKFTASRCSISGTQSSAIVMITESKLANPLLPTFVSPNRSLMNVISAHKILCLYPTLILYQKAFILQTRGINNDHHQIQCEESEIDLYGSNESWT